MANLAKILIVDDNPRYLSDALPMYGYDVDVAKNGIEALQKLSGYDSCPYDLILLDVMMPKMDGWDTLKRIRSVDKIKTIPIIMITAVNEDSKQIMGLKAGADDYITKPFILPNLLARIDALLRRNEWNREKKSDMSLNIPINGDIEPLTKREKEVLSMLAKGASNKEIADKLFVRDVTIKTHFNTIFRKLKVNNRVQAVLLAMQLGFIDNVE